MPSEQRLHSRCRLVAAALTALGCAGCFFLAPFANYSTVVPASSADLLVLSVWASGSRVHLDLRHVTEGECAQLNSDATIQVNGVTAELTARGGGTDAGCTNIKVAVRGNVDPAAPTMEVRLADSTGSAALVITNPFMPRRVAVIEPADSVLHGGSSFTVEWLTPADVLDQVSLRLVGGTVDTALQPTSVTLKRFTFALGNLAQAHTTSATATVTATISFPVATCGFGRCSVGVLQASSVPVDVMLAP